MNIGTNDHEAKHSDGCAMPPKSGAEKVDALLWDAESDAIRCAEMAGGIGELLVLVSESGNMPARCLEAIKAAAFALCDDMERLAKLISDAKHVSTLKE